MFWYLQKTLCKCNRCIQNWSHRLPPNLLLLFLSSQFQLMPSLRTVAQNRNFESLLTPFILSHRQWVSGPAPQVIQMSLPSSSKCVTLPMSPYTFRFHGTFALLPYLTVMGLMACLLFHLSYCYKNDSTKTLWLKATTFYYYFSQFHGFTGLS